MTSGGSREGRVRSRVLGVSIDVIDGDAHLPL